MQQGNTTQSQPIAMDMTPNPDGDVSQPFLINNATPVSTDEIHNDPELMNQKTVINLNNNNVRITIWCIIYIIWTSFTLQINSVQLVYYQTDTDDTYDDDSDTDTLQQLRLNGSFNGILWWASAIILCNLYCACCTFNCIKFSAVLFVIGGIMAAVTLGDQISNDCTDDSDDVGNGYCKVTKFAGYVFPILFSFYMAVDAITFIGNDIRIRMSVSALLIAIRSFLVFLFYRYQFSLIQDDDTEYWNKREIAEEKYSLGSGQSSIFSLFFWCLLILVIIMMGYGDKLNPSKKLNVWLKRIIGWFIIGATGTSLFVIFGGDLLTGWWYWLPAACLLAYDAQYL